MKKNSFKLTLVAMSCTALSLALTACGGGDSGPDPVAAAPGAVLKGVSMSTSKRFDDRSAPAQVAQAGVSADIASILSTAPFSDDMSTFNSTLWLESNWNNRGIFFSGWSPNQIKFANGQMNITLEPDTQNLTGMQAASGEYRTNSAYKYGMYQALIKAGTAKGSVSGIFTYSGADTGNQHDEIDFEFKGDAPTKMQINYWTNGQEHPVDVDLGFTSSAAFHNYAFNWTATGIQWYVDGVLVHTETGSNGALPVTPGRLMINHWATTTISPWSSDYVVPSPASVMSVDQVSFAPAVSTPAVSVKTISGSSYADVSGSGWRAAVTVKVLDGNGWIIPGAVVMGSFTAGGSSMSCTTAPVTGTCTITSAKIASTTTSSKFTLSGVTAPSFKYDSTKNIAASVTMTKP